MKGQWIGDFHGATTGRVTINIDELQSHFQGVAYLIQSDTNIPNTAAYFKTIDKNNTFKIITDSILAINQWPGTPDTWWNVKENYPNGVIPQSAEIEGKWSKSQLSLSWITDVGTHGNCSLSASQSVNHSKIKAKIINWNGFKKYISNLEDKRFLEVRKMSGS